MKKGKIIARLGVLLSLALILSYIESLIPFSFGIPGIKIGLPNIIIIYSIYRINFKETTILSILRVLLVTILFGNILSFIYSIFGAVLSLIVMSFTKKKEIFSVLGVSVSGAVSHNIGQIIAAIILLKSTQISWYLPALCISGTIAGTAIGIVSSILINRIDWLD